MSLFLGTGLFLLFFYVLLLFFFFLMQERLLFYPTAKRYQPEPGASLQPYTLQRGGVQLCGWLVNPQFARERFLIYYGGKGEDVFVNIEEFEDVQAATLFVAYRGYSPSSGTPGEAAFFTDALAVVDDIREQYQPQKLFVMGRSLGSGVACYTASKREVKGVILITPFESILRLAKMRYPWLPITRLLKHKFLSASHVAQVQAPFLVLYGGRDTVVPPQHTKDLLTAITSKKKEVYIETADHSNIDMHPQYWPAVLEFLLEQEISS